jgi:hypothetical protein
VGLTVAPGTVTVVHGLPKSGKTVLLKQLLVAHEDAGATVLVQDPDHQFAELFPVYETAADYRRAARDAGPSFRRGAAIAEVDGEVVTDLAIAAAPSARAEGRYTVLAYDEAVLAVEHASYIGPQQKNLLARRRHLGVSLVINVQDFSQIHPTWQRLATELYTFRCTDVDVVKTLAKRWGRDPVALGRRLASLQRYEWARLERGAYDDDEVAA